MRDDPEPREDETRDAVVLTGTGANAAYEVGVLKALLHGEWGCGPSRRPAIDPYCYAGISVGALNAAVMVAQTTRSNGDAVDYLERLWLTRIAGEGAHNGVFRLRADPTRYMNPTAYAANPLDSAISMGRDLLNLSVGFAHRAGEAMAAAQTPHDALMSLTDFGLLCDLSPLRQLVAEAIDFGKLRMAQRELRIGAINWELGKPHTFKNADLDGPEGFNVIAAALAMPGIVLPQVVDGYQYLDGSVITSTPLQAAIDALPRDAAGKGPVLHVVYLDTDRSPLPMPRVQNTFATIYRLYMIALSRAVGTELARIDAMNERIRTRLLFEAFARSRERDDPFMALSELLSPEAARFWKQLTRDTEDRVPVTVHCYSPTRPVQLFEFRQFYRDRVEPLISAGQQDAQAHACEEAGCILPRD
jgi:predicted acylesterase/phospholipase RssA